MAEPLIKISIAVPQEIVAIDKAYFRKLAQSVLAEEGIKKPPSVWLLSMTRPFTD